MKLFQLLDRGKVAIEGSRVWPGDRGEIRRLEVGPGIGDEASSARCIYTAEGIVQMGQVVGDAICLQVRNVEIRKVDAPLLEVSADNFAALVIRESARDEKQGSHQARQDDACGGGEARLRHSGPPDPDIGAGGSIDLYSSWGNCEFLLGLESQSQLSVI